jgi:hypothetical protein
LFRADRVFSLFAPQEPAGTIVPMGDYFLQMQGAAVGRAEREKMKSRTEVVSC